MNITTCGIEDGAPCGAPHTRGRLSVPVCGIAADESFGCVTLVTWDFVVLVNSPEPIFAARHVVPLRGRAPPVRKNNPIRITIGAAG